MSQTHSEDLTDRDPEYRRLLEAHRDHEQRLRALAGKPRLSEDEEGEEKRTDRRAEVRRLEDDDRQPVEDHVAADLRRQLRQPEQEEGAISKDVADRHVRRRGSGHAYATGGRRSGALRAALIAGSPRNTKSAMRPSRARRSIRTCRPQAWQRRPMSAPSRSMSHSDPPHGWRRRRRTTSPRSSSRTGRSGIGG